MAKKKAGMVSGKQMGKTVEGENAVGRRQNYYIKNPHAMPAETPIIVGIGASAGGLDAFIKFFEPLPATLGMAYVVIQHMAPNHESILAGLLAAHTSIPVREAQDGSAILADHIYVIPPNADLTIEQGRLRLAKRTMIQGQ